jgi:16S rRNA (guanine527-N7)-methyltransferase
MTESIDTWLPRLRDGALALGLDLSEGTLRQLLSHMALIERWNKAYNLTAVRDRSAMLTQHLLDSLAVVPALRRHLAAKSPASTGPADSMAEGETTTRIRLLDVGSGAGLPGAVLAAVEPRWSVTCVDAVGKKAIFIRQVAAELGLPNLQALHARIEQVLDPAGFDLVTSRAFASLADFLNLTEHLVAPAGCWVAMKGRVPDDEIAALPNSVEVFHVEPLSVPGLDAQRCLIWLKRRTV